MSKKTENPMARMFVKRTNKGLKDIKNIKVSSNALLILGKDKNSLEQISKLENRIENLDMIMPISKKCLNYYLRPKTRSNFELGRATFKDKKIYSKTITNDIARKYFRDADKKDHLLFYGDNIYLKGNVSIKSKKMVEIFKWHIKEKFRSLKKSNAVEEIKRLYSYEKVNLLGLKQGFLNIRNKDFYYAIGDGNYLFGKVTDVNTILKTFEVMFVLFDEYNWGENDTYFFKFSSNPDKPYTTVIETAAFKRFEKEGLAKPFLTFFVDRATYSYFF